MDGRQGRQQCGFRENRSAGDATLAQKRICEARRAKGFQTHLVYPDLQKAFDTTPMVSKCLTVLEAWISEFPDHIVCGDLSSLLMTWYSVLFLFSRRPLLSNSLLTWFRGVCASCFVSSISKTSSANSMEFMDTSSSDLSS